MSEETRFTNEDKLKLEKLPASEQNAFMHRFADIAMELRMADDAWERSRDKIGKETDALIKDIKERLKCEL